MSELKSYKKFQEDESPVNISVQKIQEKEDSISTFGSCQNFQSQVELCKNDFSKDIEINEKTGVKRYGGMLLIFVSSLLLTFVNLMAKVLQKYDVDAFSTSFSRYMGITIPAIPIVLIYECGLFKGGKKSGSIFATVWPPFKDENWKTWIGLIARGLVGSSAAILRFFAYHYLTIGDTSVIAYSTPVLVTVMAHFFLGERCGVVPIIISLTTLVGVGIVTKPPLLTGAASYETDTLIGVGLATASLICSALMVVLTRKIREVHFAVMLLVFGTVGVVQALGMIYTLGDASLDIPTELFAFALILGVGSFSFFGQMCYVLGVKFEQAGPVALIRSCDVIFSFILQFFFLGVVPDHYSAIGATIVLIGVLIIASRKWISTFEDGGKVRKYFGWVLY